MEGRRTSIRLGQLQPGALLAGGNKDEHRHPAKVLEMLRKATYRLERPELQLRRCPRGLVRLSNNSEPTRVLRRTLSPLFRAPLASLSDATTWIPKGPGKCRNEI